jgi:hypothetical protein
MKESFFTLLLLAGLVFGLSFAIPVEDDPKTPYDESEQLPYESTPLFSIGVQESARAPEAFLKSSCYFQLGSLTRCDDIYAGQKEPSVQPISDSLTILGHSLRC